MGGCGINSGAEVLGWGVRGGGGEGIGIEFCSEKGGGGDAGKDGGISRVGGDGCWVVGKESPRDGDDLESRSEA